MGHVNRVWKYVEAGKAQKDDESGIRNKSKVTISGHGDEISTKLEG